MKININIDLEASIAAALSPEKLQPILDKHITAAITSAIDDATGYRSEFRKALTAQVSEALPHGLSVSDVSKFQHILNASINEFVQSSNSEAINAALKKAIANVMPDVPAIVKMSELLKMARESFHIEDSGAFYAFYEASEYGGGGHLYLDEDARPGSASPYKDRGDIKYSANFRIAFNKEGEVYALKFDKKDVTPASRPTVITPLESVLMSMYVGRTRLEADIDDDDVESAAQEQYD
ncbi:hypothetical protein [Rhodoferax ferrireducens]|uniref:hypothetical protein n=1 Tax=Rhodoferax ferrireducens TaxID=192843 RepID=UPI000E0D77EC|nr:hypothetical protein [Rhodoferax ferrireducens]